ncbi:MAG: hypothetical protein ACKVZJ_12800 [Phycisphaerales bacterium]
MFCFRASSRWALVGPAVPVDAIAQGSSPSVVGVDIGFNLTSGSAPAANGLAQVVQQASGQRCVVGSCPSPETSLEQARVLDNGVLCALAAPNAFETITRAASHDGHIVGGARHASGWQRSLWQRPARDRFGGPLDGVVEYTLPQGGVVGMTVNRPAARPRATSLERQRAGLLDLRAPTNTEAPVVHAPGSCV